MSVSKMTSGMPVYASSSGGVTGLTSFDEHDVNTHAPQKAMVITNGRIAASIHVLIFIVLKLTVMKQATNIGTFLDISKSLGN